MRGAFLGLVLLLLFFKNSFGQSCNINSSYQLMPCEQNCTNLTLTKPLNKSTENYLIQNIPYNPFPYSNFDGNELVDLYADDLYSDEINLPFPFCFFGVVYNKVVIGSNGIITFDVTNATTYNDWHLQSNASAPWAAGIPIPYSGGTQDSESTNVYYPKASIMGAYHDIFPKNALMDLNTKIEWKVFGTAPCRRFVVNYNDVPMYSPICNDLRCTQQIVLYENTGVIEVNIKNKPVCNTWNAGIAILGIQNEARNIGIAAPGKNATVWTAVNESYRFVPNGTTNFLQSVALINGTTNATITTLNNSQVSYDGLGSFTANFSNQCQTADTGIYIVKSNFWTCFSNASTLENIDTIRTIKRYKLFGTANSNIIPCGATLGTITATATSPIGQGPFFYSIIGGGGQQANGVFQVPAGSYQVVITNNKANFCNDTIPITVISNNPVPLATVTPANCNALLSGVITASATPADTYTYSLNGVTYQTSKIFNVDSGTYTLYVKNSLNCISSTSIFVPLNNNLSIAITKIEATCTTNGTITANVSPADTYLYSLDNGVNFQTSNTFTNVPQGLYTLVVKSISGCIKSINTSIIQPNLINLGSTSVQPTCFAKGSITVFASPASSYTFSINNGLTFGTSNVFVLPAGTYNIIGKDALGCTKTLIVTLTQTNNLNATFTNNDVLCSNGLLNGSIAVNATPMGSINYSIDAGANYQASNLFVKPPGNYTIRLLSSEGCQKDFNTSINLINDININLAKTDALCSNNGLGSITANITPLSGLYQYSIDGGLTYQTSNNFSKPAGTYTIRVKTNGYTNCFKEASITINQINDINVSTIITPAICSGNAVGAITVNALPITGTYLYSIDGGINYQSANVFNKPAGNYIISVKSNGPSVCFKNINATINEINDLISTPIVTPAICSGTALGTILLNTTPTAGSYLYSIDGGLNYQASTLFTKPAGMYIINIKSNNASPTCFLNTNATIPLTNDISATASSTLATCSGLPDGVLTINALPAGGTYTYSIDGGLTFANSPVFNLTGGLYNITVKNQNNCLYNFQHTVLQDNSIVATVSTTNATCLGTDGIVTAIASPIGGFTYTFAIDGSAFGNSNIFTTNNGAHTVSIKSNTGCIKTFNALVGVTNNLIITLNDTIKKCEGQVKLLTALSNFAANTQALWSPNINLSSNNVLSPLTAINNSTWYYLNATYGLCNSVDSVFVSVTNKPIVFAGNNDTLCYKQNGNLNGTVTGNFGSFNWQPNTFLNNNTLLNPTILNPTNAVDYILSATDNGGCGFIEKDTLTITILKPFFSQLIDSLIVATNLPATIPLTLDTNNTAPIIPNIFYSYLWSPSSGLNSTNTIQPSAIINVPTWYKVLIFNGYCSIEDSILLKPYKGPEIYLPNAFVPSSTRTVNRMAIPTYVGIKTLRYYTIYNRWGQQVFTTNNMRQGWDGKLNGKEQQTQTFVAVIEAIDFFDKPIKKQQTITLIR